MGKGRGTAGFLLVRALLRWLLRLLFRVEVRGLENVPSDGYILVANHLNWIDGFLVMAFCPTAPKLYILADKRAIKKTWWRDLAASAVGRAVLIDRTQTYGEGSTLRASYRILEWGDALALFPEGNMGRLEGQVQGLQRGIGALCLRSGRPVLPVGLGGVTDLYLGKEITITVGTPFIPTSEEAQAPRRIDDITSQVQRAMEETLPPYREKPVAVKRMRWLTDLLS